MHLATKKLKSKKGDERRNKERERERRWKGKGKKFASASVR